MNPRTFDSTAALPAIFWHRIEDPCPKTWHYIYATPVLVMLVVTKHPGRKFTELSP